MKLSLSAAILIGFVSVGCGTRVTETAGPEASSSVAESEVAESPAPSYSEKPEVERLLYRAGDAIDAGQFERALAIVEEALQLDPASAQAQDMKQRITDILVRS